MLNLVYLCPEGFMKCLEQVYSRLSPLEMTTLTNLWLSILTKSILEQGDTHEVQEAAVEYCIAQVLD